MNSYEPEPESSGERSYDYIVVGAGASGSVVAARLAEKGYSVLVLEAGPDTSPTSAKQETLQYILNPFLSAFFGTNRYQAEQFPSPLPLMGNQTLLDHVSKDQPGFIDRYYSYPRGTGAGGSSQISAMVDGSGSLLNYDLIAAKMLDAVWGSDNVLRILKEMEKHPLASAYPDDYGDSGWLPIYKVDMDDLDQKIVEKLGNMGVPFIEANRLDGNEAGVFTNESRVNPNDLLRTYSYKDLLMPMLSNPENKITVKFNTLVSKVILVGDQQGKGGNPKVKGVLAYEKPYLHKVTTGGDTIIQDEEGNFVALPPDRELPKPIRYNARKEVIISAGAINTPKILMLSGIGDESELSQHGIETIVHLPGVGKDLHDHPEAVISFELNPKKYLTRLQAAALSTLPPGAISDPEVLAQITQRADFRFLSLPPLSLIIDWYSGFDPQPNPRLPDIHAQMITAFIFNYDNVPPVPFLSPGDQHDHTDANQIPDPANPLDRDGLSLKNQTAFSVISPPVPRALIGFLIETMDMGEFNGSISLQSTDPRDEPLIDLSYYNDDEGIDRLARGLLFIRNVMNDSDIKALALDPDHYEIVPGNGVQTLEEMKQYIQTWSSWGHHISGTAQMGMPWEKNAVVDSRLRVYGVDGLRVVDTSVYPKGLLHRYNPERGAYIIAEIASEFIGEE